MDTCRLCALPEIDLSASLFKRIAAHGNGRVHNVHWWFDETDKVLSSLRRGRCVGDNLEHIGGLGDANVS